ncbi:putative bifunctional diguanylate cyclase/phosphodiesterase [Marinimicrobium alkaliphilum]|uniref:putative bifunctional diguanylate cyclase/phosphodiesterase n=1 Tax=Marinimicrobium alkaliphilum TaxID=2202654 RepID=UPI000DBACABC|nr:bifunctional diguanylate cyclase/phosphodiesterase [Marinimicrobium alkaliphilum]
MSVAKTFDLIDWLRRARLPLVIVISVMILGVCFLVYVTGGVRYVFAHSMYVPIVLAAIFFGVKGGILAGLIGGLVLGPLMPIDTNTGEMQNTINWLYRVGFFSLIGFVVGFASDRVAIYIKEMKWQSSHDRPTGLPNRALMADSIRDLSKLSEREGHSHFLMGIVMSNADEVEMNFGVSAIHQLITQMAHVARCELGSSSTVYRIAHDCLGVVLPEITEADVTQYAKNLGSVYKEPLAFGGLRLHCDIYLGGVSLDGVTDDPARYIEKVRYIASESRAKKKQGMLLVSSKNDASVRENIELLGELSQALDVGQLSMHYQPKIVMKTGCIYGAEALMRWTHPVRGKIPPNMFIPRAEESTLIDLVTHFAIDQALGQLSVWEKSGISGMNMAVNISTRNLMNRDFGKTVHQLLDFHGVSGESLELEITETSFMEDVESCMENLTELSDYNVILSIDDFGTGYSSLQYLDKLPVSIIKIDQSFVRGLPGDMGSIHIVEAAVDLAHKLGMKVVAEGVETSEACDFLRNAGCDILQGYYASAPVTAEEFDRLYSQCNGQLLSYPRYGSSAVRT